MTDETSAGSSNTHAKWLQEHAAWMDASMGYVAIPAARMRDAADEIERLEKTVRGQHAGYIAMLDKAAELERRLAPETSECLHPANDLYYHGAISGVVGDFRCHLCNTVIHLPHGPRNRALERERAALKAECAHDWRPEFGHLVCVKCAECKPFVQLCAPHGKDWLTCPECAKAAVKGNPQV